jgi:ribosomal protein S18 acetylase RimI-like enzyme
MVRLSARGQGLARMMCEHSQQRAVALGYKAMQFNAVVSTNRVAITLWEKLDFRKVGVLSRAFKHPEHGYIDSFVMYKWLQD